MHYKDVERENAMSGVDVDLKKNLLHEKGNTYTQSESFTEILFPGSTRQAPVHMMTLMVFVQVVQASSRSRH